MLELLKNQSGLPGVDVSALNRLCLPAAETTARHAFFPELLRSSHTFSHVPSIRFLLEKCSNGDGKANNKFHVNR